MMKNEVMNGIQIGQLLLPNSVFSECAHLLSCLTFEAVRPTFLALSTSTDILEHRKDREDKAVAICQYAVCLTPTWMMYMQLIVQKRKSAITLRHCYSAVVWATHSSSTSVLATVWRVVTCSAHCTFPFKKRSVISQMQFDNVICRVT